eukprot:scaffold21671_cov63-Phaeocystis_antarctica.AAC.2
MNNTDTGAAWHGGFPAYMAAIQLWHQSARRVSSAFPAGAGHSATARSKYKVRSRLLELRCRARPHLPSAALPVQHQTKARMALAPTSFGAALTALADSALSPSSFHHSGLATSAHSFCRSRSKALAMAIAH